MSNEYGYSSISSISSATELHILNKYQNKVHVVKYDMRSNPEPRDLEINNIQVSNILHKYL